MPHDSQLISVVTPAYNAAAFLPHAYDCLCRQSYENWEWVVVDDGSTDGTAEMLEKWATTDNRIRFFSQPNSGSAKQPRDHAVYESKGAFILPLDSDDLLEDDYLRKLVERQIEANADIVYPEMVFIDADTHQEICRLPNDNIDTEKIYEGRQLIRETLPEWHIGCNGGLYRRHVWVNMSYPHKQHPVWMYSDEVDERHYLLIAQKVAFAKAEYTYLNHSTSITRALSPKLFEALINAQELLYFIQQHFGIESEEYHLAQRKLLNTWRNMMKLYVQNYRQLTETEPIIQQNLSNTFRQLDARHMTIGQRIRFLNLCNERLLFALFCMKYSPSCLVEKIMRHFCPDTYRNRVMRYRSEQVTGEILQACYGNQESTHDIHPYAIALFCGNTRSGGLADRLRGAISVYSACKQTSREFKLFFTHPFPLTDYLQPNSYDWRIPQEEVAFNSQQAIVVIAESLTDDPKERLSHRQRFVQELSKNKDQQVHFYTNSAFCYDEDYTTLFHELFKPSLRLQKHLDSIQQHIRQPYVTVSARFCHLLDDFNEEIYDQPLPSQQQEQLLKACILHLKEVHQQHPHHTIVVCTDSITFLELVQSLDYVYTIPGKMTHISNDHEQSYEYYEKLFLDFFTICQAEEAYLLKSPRMHQSGFPYAAALASGKQLHVITFQP